MYTYIILFFFRNDNTESKRAKNISTDLEGTNDDSIFQLLTNTPVRETKSLEVVTEDKNDKTLPNFAFESSHKADVPEIEYQVASIHLPIDWSIKSRLRILSNLPIPGNNLKTNQEASGLTSFVRCVDLENSSTGLDISPGAKFHQSSYYWQHPNLPWLTLFPRNAKTNNGFNLNEPERQCLAKDWTDSFRNLFQLVRARQCPYFYVCANSFTVLFRSAGVGGREETHVFLTPSSRGIRSALKQANIEFKMPLKESAAQLNKSGEKTPNTSLTNSSEESTQPGEDDDSDSDDLEEDKWLESMGVEAAEIRKINYNHIRKQQNKECTEDFSDQSTVLIEGFECQAFYNFLMNAKSTTAKVGRLAGVPPTLLSPVAFHGATLKSLSVRASKIRQDGEDYHSMELKGVIMPHVLPYLCNLLKETKDTFSAAMTNFQNTIAFSKVSQEILVETNKENNQIDAEQVFSKENLSDCGLLPVILERMCNVGKDAYSILESICYNKEVGGYTWS